MAAAEPTPSLRIMVARCVSTVLMVILSNLRDLLVAVALGDHPNDSLLAVGQRPARPGSFSVRKFSSRTCDALSVKKGLWSASAWTAEINCCWASDFST